MAKSPSAWHDDARDRDAGHDAMQIGFLRLCRRKLSSDNPELITHRGRQWRLWRVDFEFPLLINDRIVAFVDVLCTFERVPQDGDSEEKQPLWFILHEIKPRIYSVGAVVRQCTALAYAACSAGLKDYRVMPVIDHDDPKKELLKEVWPHVFTVSPGGQS